MERLERFGHDEDETFKIKIWKLLGSPKDVHYDDVDALYFDYSVLPESGKHMQRDSYFLFGITDKAKFVSKWIDRWELDE